MVDSLNWILISSLCFLEFRFKILNIVLTKAYELSGMRAEFSTDLVNLSGLRSHDA